MAQRANGMVAISRVKISDQVFEQLLKQIKAGIWQPGQKLPSESVLCSDLKVSRISVREAVKRLAALNLVETKQGEGTYVCSVTSDMCTENVLLPMFVMDPPSLLEICEYRLITEPGSMALAVDNITQEEIDILESYVASMEDDESDYKEFVTNDLQFHLTISRATRNGFIIKVNNFMFDMLNVGMENIVNKLGRGDGKYYHRLILDSLKNGDKETAIKAMTEHIQHTVDRIKQII